MLLDVDGEVLEQIVGGRVVEDVKWDNVSVSIQEALLNYGSGITTRGDTLMGISDERKCIILVRKIQFHEEVHYSYMIDVECATELGLPALLTEATRSAANTQAIITKLQKLLDACSGSEDVP